MPLRNSAIGIGGTFVQTNINGVPPEVVTQLVKQRADYSELQRKEIERLAAALELKERQARAALKIVYEADVPSEQQGAKLIESAERFKALLATSLATPGDSPKITDLKVGVRAAIEAGDLASADELLAQVEGEQIWSLQRQTAAYAATIAQRGEVALARLRYREAAGHFANAAAVLPQADEYLDTRFSYLSREAAAVYQQGDEYGDNASLLLAIARGKSLLERWPRERAPLQWAMAQTNLGNALWKLGERENGPARLEQAVAAYRAALEEYTRDRVPLLWAMTTGNQGSAMMVIADLTKEADVAEAAVRQIEMAYETTQLEGDEQQSAYYRAQLPRAQAIRDRLKGQSGERNTVNCGAAAVGEPKKP
jgi:tetratricopeptide (TPR) repeat protein